MASTSIIDVLEFLLDEAGYSVGHHHHQGHHGGHGHNHHHHAPQDSNRRAISQMDNWSRLVLLDQLLCMRPPEPELPPDVAEPVDRILRGRLAHRLATSSRSITPRFIVNPGSNNGIIASSFTSPPSSTVPPKKGPPRLSIWKGDITTLAHATAIVNAANSQLLGCFHPRHPCIDNAIHAAAGPRLRRACFELMAEQGHEEPTGVAKVTPGFNLHARWVVHTVGPQLQRHHHRSAVEEGMPSEEDRRALASCYEACLDAAEGLEASPGDGSKVLVFCCISTGVFGFPADEGCRVAVDAVLSWLGRHPRTTLTDILFNVFTDADLDIYRSRSSRLVEDRVLLESPSSHSSGNSNGLSSSVDVPSKVLPPSPATTTPLLAQHAALISRARYWLATSSRLIVSAGAGLSAATGLDYTSSALFTKHHWGFKKYALHSLYSVFGFDGWPSGAARWSYNMHHLDVVRRWPRSKLYADLRSFARRRFESGKGKEEDDDYNSKKRWFVRTSNADGFFAKHDFDPARISTPQGQYALVQCAARCREDAVWPSEPLIDDAMRYLDPATQHLPDDYEVPTCKFCGADLTLCVRGGDYFIEKPFDEWNQEYAAFVQQCLAEADGSEGEGERVTTTILELGVGMNTPSVLRWHNEHLVQRANGKFRLIRLGLDAAGCVDPALEEAGLAVGLYGDLTSLFEVLGIQ